MSTSNIYLAAAVDILFAPTSNKHTFELKN